MEQLEFDFMKESFKHNEDDIEEERHYSLENRPYRMSIKKYKDRFKEDPLFNPNYDRNKNL